MFEIGENRLAKRSEEANKFGRTDEVFGKGTINPASPSKKTPNRTPRIAKIFWFETVDHSQPSARDSSALDAILQTQEAEDQFKRQVR